MIGSPCRGVRPNPDLDPRVVGPIAAAGNLYWAALCVPLSASIWAVGMAGRLERYCNAAFKQGESR